MLLSCYASKRKHSCQIETLKIELVLHYGHLTPALMITLVVYAGLL